MIVLYRHAAAHDSFLTTSMWFVCLCLWAATLRYISSAVSVTGMTGLAYSLFGPGQQLSRMRAQRANDKQGNEKQRTEVASKRKAKKHR